MNVILLHGNQRHVSITHVAIFRVLRTIWPHKWPKHVGGFYEIKLHSYTLVHLLVSLKNEHKQTDIAVRWAWHSLSMVEVVKAT
jgi:hypothetical protein